MSGLEQRVSNLEHVAADMSSALRSIDESLKVLARLEEKHEATRDGVNRAFQEIEDHEKRIREIEVALPTMKLASKWVLAGVVGALAIVGTALLALVVH